MFPSTLSRETLRFEGNKIHCTPRDQSLSYLLYSKTKQKQNLKTALRFQRSRATAVNISRVTVNCFPFDVIVFATLPAHGRAHGIWRETVSLLDVMWPWTSQWMGALQREKRQLYNKSLLLYKLQWNIKLAFARILHIFTREDNMLSSHVKRSPSLWLHNKSRLWGNYNFYDYKWTSFNLRARYLCMYWYHSRIIRLHWTVISLGL